MTFVPSLPCESCHNFENLLGLYLGGYDKSVWAFIGKLSSGDAHLAKAGKNRENKFAFERYCYFKIITNQAKYI